MWMIQWTLLTGREYPQILAMIDEDFRVWLIEVNTNPYIGIYNDSMKDLLPSMLNGLYKIVLDPVFENMN